MDNEVPKKLIVDMNKSRERLRLKKPKVYSKLVKYLQAEKEGKATTMSLLDWAYGFECNFNCPHCCTHAFTGPLAQKHMSLDEIKHMAGQIDRMGIFIINLIGGEPLIWSNLNKIIDAVGPSRFHISLTTNGWFLTPEMAKYLFELGVDKVGISIDSGFEEEHDKFRRALGSFKRAVEGVKNATAVGIRTIISTVVTHQSIYSEGFKRLIDLSAELNVGLDLQCATVSGGWRENMGVLIDERDAKYLEGLRSKYPLLRRDVWSTPGSKGGCPAATRSFYITPSGDVLPCLFIHISFGNVLKESLDVIQDRMLKVKEFKGFSGLCFAGEDRDFIQRYISKTFDKEKLPLDYKMVFDDI